MTSLKTLMDLSGRWALITGGAGHLGSVLAEALAEAGANLLILDTQIEAGQALLQRLQTQYGIQGEALSIDLQDTPALQALPDHIQQQCGRLDVLIHAAALVGTSDLKGWGVPFEEQNIDTWRLALEVNLTAAFALTQACTPLLRASGQGSIVNIGSIYGVLGPQMSLYAGTSMGNPAAYAASKGALVQMTRWLATALAPEIRVNMISAGGIWRNQAPAFVERYTAHTPLGRMATEEDFKGAVLYFASDLSRYVTGQNLMVDGGWSAW